MSDSQKKELVERMISQIAERENWNKELKDAAIKAVGAAIAKKLIPLHLFAAALVMGCSWTYASMGRDIDYNKVSPDDVRKYIEEFFPQLVNTYTACLSSSRDNFLMWSHYANSHKGMVIGFDSEKMPFATNPPIKVNYTDKRFTFYSRNFINRDVWSDVKDALLTKYKVWEYEEEYRFFFNALKNKTLIKWYDHHHNPIIMLNKDSIVEVCFGCRVTQEQREIVREELSSHSWSSKINIYECVLKTKNYGLEINRL